MNTAPELTNCGRIIRPILNQDFVVQDCFIRGKFVAPSAPVVHAATYAPTAFGLHDYCPHVIVIDTFSNSE